MREDMRIPLKKKIPFWSVDISGSELEGIERVLSSSYLNEGAVNAEFERLMAEFCGVSEVITTTSGTSALHLALLALGVGYGDEVIVPDITFAATINAVHLTGATPVVVDVSYESALMSLEHLAAALSPRTKAIIPVHIAGRLAVNEEFLETIKKANVCLIEDAAEAFLSRGELGLAGSIGDCGCFSLSPNKLVTTGQGGFITTDNKALARRLRCLKNQGRVGVVTGGGNDRYLEQGLNSKLTDLQAAVGIAQLERVWDRIALQKKKYKEYGQSALGSLGELSFYQYGPDEVPLWTDLKIKNADRCSRVDTYLAAQGIEIRRYWRPLSETFNGVKNFTSGVAQKVSNESIWLPSAFSLTESDIQYTIDAICGFLDG